MRIIFLVTSFVALLGGCQSLGEHYNCMAEVDRLVPAQTQQRYVRTDTKCVKSNEQTYQITGGYTGKVYNPGQGDVNCSSVPIYDTIVLNKPQRDTAYQQCRNSYTGNRGSNGNQRPGDVMSLNDAKSICTNNGLKDGTPQHTS